MGCRDSTEEKACLASVVGETYQAGIPRESIDHLVHFMKSRWDELWVAECRCCVGSSVVTCGIKADGCIFGFPGLLGLG